LFYYRYLSSHSKLL